MMKWIAALAVLLAGCSAVQQSARVPSACDASEVSYECQVARYGKVNAD